MPAVGIESVTERWHSETTVLYWGLLKTCTENVEGTGRRVIGEFSHTCIDM